MATGWAKYHAIWGQLEPMLGFPRDLVVKNPLAMQEPQETQVRSQVRKDPWRRAGQSTPVFLFGKSHGERSLAGFSPWGCKELDTTEAT